VTRRSERADRRRIVTLVSVMVAAVTLAACGGTDDGAEPGEPLRVAAASDLMPAFAELGEHFEDETGETVVFSFGSSGQLAQQLIEGAPMDLYLAANVAFVERVLDQGVGDPATQMTYAHGRLALWATEASWGDWDDGGRDDLVDLAAQVTAGGIGSVAIANPEHAPYGQAARQAMETAEVWSTLQPSLVFGENVADAYRLAATGNADAAIIAVSLARAADLDADDAGGTGRWVLVDGSLHEPLQQDLVITTSDPRRAQLAQRFIDHLTGPRGRDVLERFGLRPEGG